MVLHVTCCEERESSVKNMDPDLRCSEVCWQACQQHIETIQQVVIMGSNWQAYLRSTFTGYLTLFADMFIANANAHTDNTWSTVVYRCTL